MSALAYIAALNERQQVTFSVAGPAATYPGTIASATWRMQVRPSGGSPTIYLDSNVNGTVTYVGGAAPIVILQWPTSAVAAIPSSGPVAFDFGFILPGADFELAGFGFVTFVPGVTRAGVVGSPAPPTGADDTWTLVGASLTPTSPSLASAVAAANSSAVAAAASAAAAAASAASIPGNITAQMAAWFATLPTSPNDLEPGTPYNNGNTLGFA